jgi:large subunit ribosomal protein L11
MAIKQKQVTDTISLEVELGKANPAPPIGPALGQKGVNIMEFCKQFNAIKMQYPIGTPIPVKIFVYKDKSFTFETKQPPVVYLIKLEIGLKKGSIAPGKELVGKITMKQLENVAKKKMVDMNSSDLDACVKMVKGAAISMGLEIVE